MGYLLLWGSVLGFSLMTSDDDGVRGLARVALKATFVAAIIGGVAFVAGAL